MNFFLFFSLFPLILSISYSRVLYFFSRRKSSIVTFDSIGVRFMTQRDGAFMIHDTDGRGARKSVD